MDDDLKPTLGAIACLDIATVGLKIASNSDSSIPGPSSVMLISTH
ncbi:hypothetical protein C8J23_12115 [Shewanella chilikensis]|uniref:Uncharacterized protein n=1 Tax=Shewanella chilikensis TaxID=558541 RepID=A0ABX5PLN8_9GAMM|nr:hypothetical protein C8J23_12115 [Shewanella chilikensis]